MKEIYTTTTLADAEIVRMLLRKHRISSMLEGAGAGLVGPATPFVVTVRDQDAVRARKLIDGFKKKRRASKRRPSKRKKSS